MPKIPIRIVCSVCDNRHYAKGYCYNHYRQVRKNGRITPAPKPCEAQGCEIICIRARYCDKHQTQIRKYGRLTPEIEKEIGNVGCKFPGCPRAHRSKGFCMKHYMAQRREKISALLKANRGISE